MLVWARQVKAARSLIGWEQFQLAVAAGVGIATIRRLERMTGPINAKFETIDKIRRALEGAGIEFIGEPKPGVCVRLEKSQESYANA
ncbi:transcriptional regulator [Bradyrhizobium sp. Pear77]|uniref:helix-turn-helix domain-containing protein n=1 Tax=Bradyrhizobium altum TaxID=1571202 RepID=UPI001E306A70|nr:helix-turn-helix transcriptional regulator [Bradyrhizobium altum]MCC8953544.1 transcriptional regulator [Bradyrhizobium altum]